MYVDVIKSITDAEEAARQEKQTAQARAKNEMAEAEKKGQAALAEAAARAEEENKKRMQASDKKAVENALKLESETSELRERIRAGAVSRLDPAASLIVERIVNS